MAMTTRRKKPARATAPGRIVARELEARSWTIETLASYSGLSIETVNGVVYGSKPVTDQVAQGLAQAFGSTVELWKNLELNYHEHHSDNRSLA